MAVRVIEAAPRARVIVPVDASLNQASAAKAWVLALTSLASFMVALDALVVSTALSTIRVDFGTTIEALGWTVNAYNLSFAERVVLEDVVVHAAVAACAPLALSTWRGRTGLSYLPPLRWCGTRRVWADNVDIHVAQLRKYAQAVHSATDSYFCRSAPAPDRLILPVLTALLQSLRQR